MAMESSPATQWNPSTAGPTCPRSSRWRSPFQVRSPPGDSQHIWVGQRSRVLTRRSAPRRLTTYAARPATGDNSVDLYINDVGAVVIMNPDGKTVKGFNVVVGGGMGRTHRKEVRRARFSAHRPGSGILASAAPIPPIALSPAQETFARAADHLGFVKEEDFFECMKAIIAVQRDHGNREVLARTAASRTILRAGPRTPAAAQSILRICVGPFQRPPQVPRAHPRGRRVSRSCREVHGQEDGALGAAS